MKTYIVEAEEVQASSVQDLKIGTADKDNAGYLIQSGVNRCLKSGITTDGRLTIWVETNGNRVLIGEGLWEAAYDMGDIHEGTEERFAVGLERILEAVETLRTQYFDNESAKDDLDWYVDEYALSARAAFDAAIVACELLDEGSF